MTSLDLRKTLRASGPGHTIEDLHNLGFGDGVRADLEALMKRGEATRYGKYYWLKVRVPKSYPKQAPPPPAQPIKAALSVAGIHAEQGRVVIRTPRRKAS